MTAGRGIAHAERTPATNTGRLSGIQLWAALPGTQRHRAIVSACRGGAGGRAAGRTRADLLRRTARRVVASPSLFGCVRSRRVGPLRSLAHPADAAVVYEYAVLVLDGTIDLDGRRLEDRSLYYLGTRRSEASLASSTGGRLLLIGGPPFPETILMWWNFVARSGEEITHARDDSGVAPAIRRRACLRRPPTSSARVDSIRRPNPLS